MSASPSRVNDRGGMNDEITSIRPAAVVTLRPTSRGKIVGRDPQIKGILDTVDRVARSTCTVLITGESGTGKELIVAALPDTEVELLPRCGHCPQIEEPDRLDELLDGFPGKA